nr:hypothetical protein [Tanacetum cinerariifolium]
DSEEELSWKSSDEEEVGSHEEGKESDIDSDEGSDKDTDETVKSGAGKDGDEDDDEDDDDDEEEETAKNDEEDKGMGKGDDEVRKSGGESEEEVETSEEEEGSFDPILRTPEDSEKESDDEDEQESRLSEEARIQEEEDAEELYRDVNINQGRGLQVTQSVEDTHVILTPNVLNGLVKNQVKEQVSHILPRIEESMNATLEAEVLTRSSHSSRTSYAVAADLSEIELKKILIEKMEVIGLSSDPMNKETFTRR